MKLSLPSKIVPDYECLTCHSRAHIDIEAGRIVFRKVQDQQMFEGKGSYIGGSGHPCPLLEATTEADLLRFIAQGVIIAL